MYLEGIFISLADIRDQLLKQDKTFDNIDEESIKMKILKNRNFLGVYSIKGRVERLSNSSIRLNNTLSKKLLLIHLTWKWI